MSNDNKLRVRVVVWDGMREVRTVTTMPVCRVLKAVTAIVNRQDLPARSVETVDAIWQDLPARSIETADAIWDRLSHCPVWDDRDDHADAAVVVDFYEQCVFVGSAKHAGLNGYIMFGDSTDHLVWTDKYGLPV